MHAQQAVSTEEGEFFANMNIPNSFFAQVSAKENDGITELFETFAQKLYKIQTKVRLIKIIHLFSLNKRKDRLSKYRKTKP